MNAFELNHPKIIPKVVSEARKFWGFTQRELASKAGVSQKFVSDVERGKETVQLKQFLMVFAALDVKITVDLSRLIDTWDEG